MTEAEWLTNENAQAALSFITPKATERKLRLFACAVCRRVWHMMRHADSHRAIELAERLADGHADDAERHEVRRLAAQATQARGIATRPTDERHERRAASAAYYSVAGEAAKAASGASDLSLEARLWHLGGYAYYQTPELRAERGHQTYLLRDIFGNPFRPVAFSPSWRTSDAVALARTMYEAREFGAMPIMADALQDAGCDNDDILNHCRDTAQVHVRGCWVVDLVLGKS